ncbi:hypothetical protein SAMN04488048_1255 [Trichococcus flocculiformis]|uniref:hypothetical protein n=1 Tax=Trichococcus TaxID=82802 RepID=UPI0007A8DD88|nr:MULTISPECIES: hypothetical protein [Trichococcus]CZR08816.1 Hypothetical protein TES5_2615 [Trichococcus sp. ES5]SHG06759.1 hypothetical protein SAMN04488048_1255 [Trichococcus flocculiformis]
MTQGKSELVSVYIHGIYKGKIKADTETIAHVVAGALPYENYAIVKGFNKLVLTTFGNFLNNVPDQEWLKRELLPILIPLQIGQEDIKKVTYQ